jgi:glycosyltransferase involved in cell wall biosynthesis
MTSVVIPAHNEASRIGRCLRALLEPSNQDLEIVVVANGCADATADEARSFGPRVSVLEIDPASKTAALNAGDAHATTFPRFYLDADVVIRLEDLERVARILEDPGILLAAPGRHWIDEGRPWLVRSYLRFLRCLPQVESGLTGGGVLGISEAGRRRFEHFPDVLGDDLWLDTQFEESEKRLVREATSLVQMPRSVSGLVARRTRVVLANREARPARRSGRRAGKVFEALRARPRLLLDLPAFLFITGLAELRARQRLHSGDIGWDRDESSR